MAKKRRHRRLRPEKRRARFISTVVMVIASCVFLFAGFYLFLIFSEYNKSNNEYESLEETVISIQVPNAADKEETVFKVDFDKLKEINSDVLAWIRFENPEKISYPVVAGIDNDVYLTKTFEGNYNSSGTLFTDMNNSGNFKERNTFIYGHNMKNGSMFGQLRKYQEEKFCVENPYFYIYTPDGREMKYQVFATCIVKDTSDSFTKWYENDSEFMDYINYEKRMSLYSVDIEVETDDTIVTLSTCTNVRDDERLLVHGVKVSERIIED